MKFNRLRGVIDLNKDMNDIEYNKNIYQANRKKRMSMDAILGKSQRFVPQLAVSITF